MIKKEPQTPVASVVHHLPRKSKRRVSPSPVMPVPLERAGTQEVLIKREAVSPTRKKGLERFVVHNGKLLGGQEENAGDTIEEVSRPAKKERNRNTIAEARPEKRDRSDEVPKLKGALKKYEATVCKLVHKLKSEQASYQKAIQELQNVNESLRDEITSIRDTIYEMTSQRGVEQELVTKLKGDNSNLLEKNGQLEEDLTKMIQNIQHSDSVLEEMRQKIGERDNEMTNLATEKKYLVQQLDDMRRLSRMSLSTDAFTPGEGRKGSSASGVVYMEGGCSSGVLGWLCGQGSISKMIFLGSMLLIGLWYFFQNVRSAQAFNPAECQYDIEMFEGI